MDTHEPITLSHLRLNIIFHYKARNCHNLFSQVLSKNTRETANGFRQQRDGAVCREEDPQEMALWSQRDQETSGNTDFPFLSSLVGTSASGSSSSSSNGTPASLPQRWIRHPSWNTAESPVSWECLRSPPGRGADPTGLQAVPRGGRGVRCLACKSAPKQPLQNPPWTNLTQGKPNAWASSM